MKEEVYEKVHNVFDSRTNIWFEESDTSSMDEDFGEKRSFVVKQIGKHDRMQQRKMSYAEGCGEQKKVGESLLNESEIDSEKTQSVNAQNIYQVMDLDNTDSSNRSATVLNMSSNPGTSASSGNEASRKRTVSNIFRRFLSMIPQEKYDQQRSILVQATQSSEEDEEIDDELSMKNFLRQNMRKTDHQNTVSRHTCFCCLNIFRRKNTKEQVVIYYEADNSVA